jgi:hypothetical protein
MRAKKASCSSARACLSRTHTHMRPPPFRRKLAEKRTSWWAMHTRPTDPLTHSRERANTHTHTHTHRPCRAHTRSYLPRHATLATLHTHQIANVRRPLRVGLERPGCTVVRQPPVLGRVGSHRGVLGFGVDGVSLGTMGARTSHGALCCQQRAQETTGVHEGGTSVLKPQAARRQGVHDDEQLSSL